MIKKIVLFVLVLISSLFFSCSNGTSTQQKELLIQTLKKDSKEKDDRENTLVIGLDDSFPPMGFRNENNEIVGVDIDIANAVCEKLGMKLKLQQISWASKEQELDSGNIDCIWNGFAYTEDRAKTMTLTDTYIKTKM